MLKLGWCRGGARNSLPSANKAGDSSQLEKHASEILKGARQAIIMQPPSERQRAAANARKKPRLSEAEIRDTSRAGTIPLYAIINEQKPQLLFRCACDSGMAAASDCLLTGVFVCTRWIPM